MVASPIPARTPVSVRHAVTTVPNTISGVVGPVHVAGIDVVPIDVRVDIGGPSPTKILGTSSSDIGRPSPAKTLGTSSSEAGGTAAAEAGDVATTTSSSVAHHPAPSMTTTSSMSSTTSSMFASQGHREVVDGQKDHDRGQG